MEEGRENDAHRSRWKRWTTDEGPFYRSCAVFPFDELSDENVPTRNGERKPTVEFATGSVRLLLRNIPAFLLLVLAVYVPVSILGYARSGRIPLSVPSLQLSSLLLAGLAVLLGGIWLYVLYRVITPTLGDRPIHRTVVFILTTTPLAVATAHAVYTVGTSAASISKPPVTIQAGYFLFVLVEGHLVYDGLALRTENLFKQLGSTGVVDQAKYERFYEDLAATLGDTVDIGSVSVPRSVAFSFVLALGPILLPVVALSWGWTAIIAYVPYSIVTLFVIAVLFDVFVLVYKFTELLRNDVLRYQPFHPDEHGGFRDLGRFATRINVILVVAGGYVVYRFSAEGMVNFPTAGFGSSLNALTWVLLYVGPIVAYVFLVLFWLYHS